MNNAPYTNQQGAEVEELRKKYRKRKDQVRELRKENQMLRGTVRDIKLDSDVVSASGR